MHELSSCDSKTQQLHHTGSEICQTLVPQTGIEPTSPALQNRLLINEPPGKSWDLLFLMDCWCGFQGKSARGLLGKVFLSDKQDTWIFFPFSAQRI